MTTTGAPPMTLTVQEVMAELRLGSRTSVYALLRSGQLESIRVGRSRRIPRRSLEAFIESGLRAQGADE
ncbi:MAG: helix-turn-helix domain-containing protein [Armatimonadetes bacterium]|nr:helix-turn-helix domain-containing protein [Armatimonadota bacterium]